MMVKRLLITRSRERFTFACRYGYNQDCSNGYCNRRHIATVMVQALVVVNLFEPV